MTEPASVAVARQKLRKTRTNLILRSPFIASFVVEAEAVLHETPPPGFPPGMLYRAATDGRHIFFNSAWVAEEGVTQDELAFTLAHEAMHIAWGHHIRRGERCPLVWNIATDYVINVILQEDGFYVPHDVLLSHAYRGMSSERVYDLVREQLQEEAQQAQQGQQGGQGGQGGGEGQSGCSDPSCPAHGGQGQTPWDWVSDMTNPDGSPLSEAQREVERQRVEVAVQQAVQMERSVKGIGRVSMAAQRATQAITKSRTNWRNQLAHLLMVSRRDDYTYRRPNRRYLPQGFYLPTLHNPSLGDVVVGTDCSGSIGDKQLAEFTAEMEGILTAFPGTRLHILYWDTAICGQQEVGAEDIPLKLDAKGGGGSDVRAMFDWVEEHRQDLDLAALVVLTDLYVSGMPKHEPDYPVVWVVNTNQKHPWGERVQIPVEGME